MNVCIFNVKYSQNVGDGLIAECLERAIKQSSNDIQCHSIDLAGRTSHTKTLKRRTLIMGILSKVPEAWRPYAMLMPMMLFCWWKWKPFYARSLKDCDAIIIGGGNLLTDIDLNFPVKIAAVLQLAAQQKIPVLFYACGVGGHWSPLGKQIFRRALKRANVVKCAFRDKASVQNWMHHFGDASSVAPEVVWDPGMLTSTLMVGMKQGSSSPLHVGLGVTSPLALRYHTKFTFSDKELAEWYGSVYSALLAAGYSCTLFTNGTAEDEDFLAKYLHTITASSKNDAPTGFPASPENLVSLISGFDGVIAHRMHAIIPAYTLGIPFVALKWDAKLDALLNEIKLPHRLASAVSTPAKDIINKLFNEADSTIFKEERLSVAQQTLHQIKYLANKLEEFSKEMPPTASSAIPIYINGRYLTKKVTGVERFAHEMVMALDTLLVEKNLPLNIKLVAPANTPAPAGLSHIKFEAVGPLDGHAWEQWTLYRFTRSGFLLNFCNSAPVFHFKQLTIIHDAAVYRMPKNYSFLYRTCHQILGHALALRSSIGTVSAFSRGEVSKILKIDEQNIPVFHNGYEHILRHAPQPEILETLKIKNRPYFLFVGSPAPNKNLAKAIKAFELLNRPDIAFVIVGAAKSKVFNAATLSHVPNVIMAGRLSDNEIVALYQKATALVFPSLYEGFGIPPLEAMALSCPVIATHIAPVQEVCADTALYFDPLDANAIAKQMALILDSAETRSKMIDLERARFPIFSWKASAEKLLDWVIKNRAN